MRGLTSSPNGDLAKLRRGEDRRPLALGKGGGAGSYSLSRWERAGVRAGGGGGRATLLKPARQVTQRSANGRGLARGAPQPPPKAIEARLPTPPLGARMAELARLPPELAGIGCIIPPKPQAPTLLEIGGGRRRLGDTPENLLKEDHYPPLPDGYRTPTQPQPAFSAASNPVAFLHAWQKPGAGMGQRDEWRGRGSAGCGQPSR